MSIEKGVPVEIGDDEILTTVSYQFERNAGGRLGGFEIEQVSTVEGRDITGELNDYQLEQIIQWLIGRMTNDY